MDDDSTWKRFFEATLALPLPEYDAYKEGGAPCSSPLPGDETGQKARGIHQAFIPFSPVRPGSSQSSNITDTDNKGQVLEATADPVAKKRMTDKLYRERCKAEKLRTMRELEVLRKENERLRGENASVKREADLTRETLQSQEDEMKRLRKTSAQLQKKYDKQNTIVEVLSKRVAGPDDTDLQSENVQLKGIIVVLRSQMSNGNNLDKLQLQEKIAQLEHDKNSLEVIVQALCEKINNENREGP